MAKTKDPNRKEVHGPRFFSRELEIYRRDAIQAARELWYGQDIVDRILTAKSVTEITRIMTSARKGEL